MVGTSDPYYNRKPVPDELIKDVGLTGLSREEEHWNRERKYSAANGVDVRKFSNSRKGGFEPQDDPYYGRKQVSQAEIANVGATGLSPEEEFWNRERKYSVTGVDVRKFSTSKKGGMEPQDDPYYGRKRVSNAEIVGIGETGMTPAETYEVRERKQSLFQLSDDPFDMVAGRHRQSVSGVASSASAAATRRRSSAVAPDAAAAAASHSGYHGDKLAPIESRPEIPPVDVGGSSLGGHNSPGLSEASTHNGAGEHTKYHDATTVGHDHKQSQLLSSTNTQPQQIHYEDPDAVAPDERR